MPDNKPDRETQLLSSIDEELDTVLKAHITPTILKAITKNGQIEPYTAFREVMAVTNRTLSTIKNWLAFGTNVPDFVSLVRIWVHWNIPTDTLLPASLVTKLSAKEGSSPVVNKEPWASELEALDLIPTSTSDTPAKRQAMAFYSKNPEKTLFIRQEDSDNDQVRPGELFMIDASIEELRGDGFYLLKINRIGTQSSSVCLRFISMMVSEPAVRLSRSSTSTDGVEVIPLQGGTLPPNVVVLGRVIAVLRKLF